MRNRSCIQVALTRFSKESARLLSWIIVASAFMPLCEATDLEKLKRLSIEELMEVEVTSVSRSPVALGVAPSALQVITGWEIRRSGASNLPQALRYDMNGNALWVRRVWTGPGGAEPIYTTNPFSPRERSS